MKIISLLFLALFFISMAAAFAAIILQVAEVAVTGSAATVVCGIAAIIAGDRYV